MATTIVTRNANDTGTTTEFVESDEFYGNIRLKDTDVLEEGEDTILSMKNVHKTYLLGVEGIPALRGVSLTVRRGEFIVIFGTSGGGKTTMLNLIGTIDKPTKGDMYLCGERITDRTKDSTLADIRLRRLGFVFQTFNLLSSLTALENVEMPMILAGHLSPGDRKRRAKALLKDVGLSHRLSHFPSQLSGGEQQRVTIARAIANEPDLLLLDEPTGDLDSVNGAIVMNLLTNLHEKHGITLVMVTHDVHLKMFADRVIWMRDGKIQRIEEVAEEQKEKARANLAAQLEAAKHKEDAKVLNTVEIRQPSDYETHPQFSGKSNAKLISTEHALHGQVDAEAVENAAATLISERNGNGKASSKSKKTNRAQASRSKKKSAAAAAAAAATKGNGAIDDDVDIVEVSTSDEESSDDEQLIKVES